MCGINLIVDRTGSATLDRLEGMMDATRLRGPDRSRMKIIQTDKYQILFGVNRLCIIDEDPGSDQPFTDQEESHFLLYNGEIYNQAVIRNDLIREGISFSTFSDTEVLYHYLTKNPNPVPFRIQGMYAYIFIDIQREILFISRDPRGMKPLYYFQNDRFLIISSEISGVLASGLVEKILNVDQISWYLRYRYTEPPHTLLKDIFAFLKGHTYHFGLRDFKFTESGRTAVNFIHEVNNRTGRPESDPDEKKLLNDVEDLLVDSLISHTQSVRPPGLFLSGGVDSTLLLALADKHSISLPYVFSIVNRENDRAFGTDDFKYARLAIEKFHPSASIVELDHSVMQEIPDFIGMVDHPVGDPAYFLTYKLASRAAAVTNVVLSGAGADEFFGGYNRHIAFYYYLKYYNMTRAIRPLIRNYLRFLPSGYSFPGRKNLVLLKKLFNKIGREPWQTYDNFLAFEKFNPDRLIHRWDMNKMKDPVNEILFLALLRDRKEYLPEDILAISDRACMLNSVEMRMPYLDDHIVNYMQEIKPRRLVARGRKWILRSILKKYGGERFANRPKEGFGFPFGHWIKKPEYSNLVSGMSNEKNLIYNYIDRKMILNLIQDHFSGRDDHTQEIWSFLMLNGWIEKNFN